VGAGCPVDLGLRLKRPALSKRRYNAGGRSPQQKQTGKPLGEPDLSLSLCR